MTDKPKVYNTLAEAEAARAAGEPVDLAHVKGDDGYTDDERRIAKQKRSKEAQRKSNEERARIEQRDGLEPGTLGRNAETQPAVFDSATGRQIVAAGQQRPDDVSDDDLREVGVLPGDVVTAEAINEVYRRRAEAGGATSAGSSSEPSPDGTVSSDAPKKQDPQPTAPETGTRSSGGRTGSSAASSTGTSGKGKR